MWLICCFCRTYWIWHSEDEKKSICLRVKTIFAMYHMFLALALFCFQFSVFPIYQICRQICYGTWKRTQIHSYWKSTMIHLSLLWYLTCAWTWNINLFSVVYLCSSLQTGVNLTFLWCCFIGSWSRILVFLYQPRCFHFSASTTESKSFVPFPWYLETRFWFICSWRRCLWETKIYYILCYSFVKSYFFP